MNYFLYILRSKKDGKRYIGITENIERRLDEHQRGHVKSTRNRRPLELIYQEKFCNKQDAALRERFFKMGKGREFLKNQGIV